MTLQATSVACGGLCSAETTAGDGSFTFWLPAATDGAVVVIAEQNLPGYASTGGSPGDTGGSYALAADTVTFTDAGGSAYSGLEFGDLSGSSFSPNHQGNALPGSVMFYAHTFVATLRTAT